MNNYSDHELGFEELKEKLIIMLPLNDGKHNVLDFHVYLLYFLEQQITQDDSTIKLSEQKETIGTLKFGLLCYVALINLQNRFLIFKPELNLDPGIFSEEDFEYLQSDYIISLIQNIYSVEARDIFKIDIEESNLFFLMQRCNDKNIQKTFIVILFEKSTEDIVEVIEKIINQLHHEQLYYRKQRRLRTNKVVVCDECVKGIKFIPFWGYGYIPFVCDKCKGCGTYHIPVPLDDEDYCPLCNGSKKMVIISGEVNTDKTKTINFWDRCNACEGIGVVPKKVLDEK